MKNHVSSLFLSTGEATVTKLLIVHVPIGGMSATLARKNLAVEGKSWKEAIKSFPKNIGVVLMPTGINDPVVEVCNFGEDNLPWEKSDG